MYVLIRIETNDLRIAEKVSKNKKTLEKYIKTKGFYWSEKNKRYIDDKTVGINGGSGVDYVINHIDEI